MEGERERGKEGERIGEGRKKKGGRRGRQEGRKKVERGREVGKKGGRGRRVSRSRSDHAR